MTPTMIMMSHIAILITALSGLIASIASLRAAMGAKEQVQEIHLAINGRLDALLQLTATASHAKGVKEEQDRVK